MLRIACFLLLLLVGSCLSSDQGQNKDTSSYILSDIQTHLKTPAYVLKTMQANGKTQEIQDTILDWKDEFKLFLKYIPAEHILYSDYTITEYPGYIQYQTQDKNKALKDLKISTDSLNKTYDAQVSTSNGLNYATYHLYWHVGHGKYRIDAVEGIAHSREMRYILDGKMLDFRP